MRPIFSPAPPPPCLPPLRPLLTTCLLLSCAHGHAPSIHACVHKLPKLGIVFPIASLRAHSLFSDHFTHVLPVNCAIFFYSSFYSFLFFFSFLLSINRSPSRTRFHDSIGEMESGDRSPFSAPIHFRVAIQRYWSGRIERGPAVYIYVYIPHEIRQGRENERSIGSRLTTGTTRTGFSSRTGGRRLFFCSLPLPLPLSPSF